MNIRIPVADGEIGGYLAVPSGAGPFPAVVLIHDVLGLNQDAREITDRYAAAGYLALSPDLYSRGGMLRCVKRTFQDLFAREGRAFADIEAARVLVAGRDDATGKVGVVGFCMGGGFALVAASRDFDASAPYYGQLPKDLSILDGSCPIVGSFGRKDVSCAVPRRSSTPRSPNEESRTTSRNTRTLATVSRTATGPRRWPRSPGSRGWAITSCRIRMLGDASWRSSRNI